MSRTFDESLALYAALAVRKGVNLQPGQELIVSAELGDAPLVRLVAEEAYRAGAKNVEVLWQDPELSLARFREGSDEALNYAPAWLIDGVARAFEDNTARLGIFSSDPGLLGSVAPEKVAVYSKAQSAARKRLSELITSNALNWSLVGAASPGWACKVFPGLPESEAVQKLWDAIFTTCRFDAEDPLAAWDAHVRHLLERQTKLNEMRIDTLHFRGPGTDLRVGLVDDHVWIGGGSETKRGVAFSPNIPTEEVFTMPHRDRVNGVVSSTKPLSVRGQVVDGIQMEFQDGVAVRATAREGQETIERLLGTDEGAKRLGEVALVPAGSKVAETGVLFLNTLYDENAASHIALGACYSENSTGHADRNEDERLAHGANDSLIHVDWMIGSAETDVDALLKSGETVPLMRAGEWV